MPEQIVVVATEGTTSGLLPKLLQDGGYSTTVASSPQEAREFLRTQEVDGVILATHFRDSNDFDVCYKLRETLGPWVVIMVVCPPAPTYHYVVALQLGVDDVVVMPVVAEELLARLAAHLRRRRLRAR